MIGKRLKEEMEDWDQEDAARFISKRKGYNESDVERDILSEKINILAELVDQKIDLLFEEKEIENRVHSAELEFLRQRNEEAKRYKKGKRKEDK